MADVVHRPIEEIRGALDEFLTRLAHAVAGELTAPVVPSVPQPEAMPPTSDQTPGDM